MGLFLATVAEEIVELFGQVVASCAEQNLIEFDLLAIDSVKLPGECQLPADADP